jgi:hypothetical protein
VVWHGIFAEAVNVKNLLICFALKKEAAPLHKIAAGKSGSPEGCGKLAGG